MDDSGESSRRTRRNVLLAGGLSIAGVALGTDQAHADVTYIPTTEKGAASGVATLDTTTKVPLAQIPDVLQSRSGNKSVGQGEIVVNVLDYGSLSSASTSDATIAAAIAACAALGGGAVRLPSTLSGSPIPFNHIDLANGVVLEGMRGGSSRYYGVPASPNTPFGATTLKCMSGSTTTPAISMTGAACGLRHLNIDANHMEADVIYHSALESIMEEVRVIGGNGIGINVARGNNSWWRHIVISGCGKPGVYDLTSTPGTPIVVTPALPQMKIWTDGTLTGTTTSTNAFTLFDLSIENGGSDVSLEIGNVSGSSEVQYLRLNELHVENTWANQTQSTSAGVEATIKLQNVDGVSFIDPLIYGGGPTSPIVRHDQNNAAFYSSSGVKLLGGHLLGSGTLSGVRGSGTGGTLIDLRRGDGFELLGTELSRFTGPGWTIAGAYGRFYAAPSTVDSAMKSGTAPMDSRTTRNAFRTPSEALVTGRMVPATTSELGVHLGLDGGTSPGIAFASGAHYAEIRQNTSTLAEEMVFDGAVRYTFDPVGALTVGGLRLGTSVQTSNFTIPNVTSSGAGLFQVLASGTITITLPNIGSSVLGRVYSIKNWGTGTVTVATQVFQKIDADNTGSGGVTSFTLAPGKSRLLLVDGAGFQSIGGVF